MTELLALFAIAGLVWGLALLLRGDLAAGCLAYLAAACCFGPYFLQFDAGITWSLDRLLLVGLVGLLAVQWRLGRTRPRPWDRADYVLAALIAALLVSTFTHDWRTTSPQQVPIVQHLINGYLIPLTLYFIARRANFEERHAAWVFGFLALFGAYLAVTGLLETAGMWSLVFPRYIADPAAGIHFGRARGPMVHSVSFGVYLTACLLAIWLWRPRLDRRWQLVWLAIVPLLLAAIFFTKTRTVWIGAGAGLFVVLAVTLQGRLRTAVLGSMVAAALMVGLFKSDALVGFQREGSVQETAHSASMRKSFTYVSWKMFLDRPLLGFGFGQFAQAKLPYLSDRTTALPLEEIRPYVHHNTFLAVLTETGLVGLTLFVGVYALWCRAAWRLATHRRAPPWMRNLGALTLGVLAAVVCQMLAHEITFTPLEHALVFFLCGLTVSLAAEFEVPSPTPTGARLATSLREIGRQRLAAPGESG